ncbi:hypothetical protein [Arsenicibacter rosenii]|uniref:Secretion system C-terminal sorting domain-containing protein n=1 Tax=Arsenicibacter rosenii TaxID=1750698 RepID=A0A1S2VFW8_9BACT|nr:hypothetical protein [Arsenicibacter rosenii]OIN57599.1 hypothetical protein BLX24_19155 [Arsenicibacter rosenii]
MKTIRLSVTSLLLMGSLVSMGGALTGKNPEVRTVKVVKSERKKFRLYIPSTLPLGGSQVQVSLTDADGNVLHQGTAIDRYQQGISYDLNSLPDGQYFLAVTNDAWWTSQPFEINGNTLSVDDKRVTQVMRPVVSSYAKNKVQLTVQSTNVPEMTVALYDKNNELVFAEHMSGVVKRYDLSTLPAGRYTMSVGSPAKKFSELIDISH